MLGHFYTYLFLKRHVGEDKSLHSSKKERSQYLVQLRDDALAPLLAQYVLHAGVLADVAEREPRLEYLQVVEYHRVHEVQQ